LVPSPAGHVFTQATAQAWSSEEHLVFACGRYEGIDERVMVWAAERFDVRPFSLGDYVLNGGEVATLAIIEAVGRLIPGMVGNPDSLVEESHSDGLLEYPIYTKPASWEGYEVPAVLLSGDHGKVAESRRRWQWERTSVRRPDLIEAQDVAALGKADRTVLEELGWDLDGDRPHR
jgi:tRNA (guanine37-N1)-methyltransferase